MVVLLVAPPPRAWPTQAAQCELSGEQQQQQLSWCQRREAAVESAWHASSQRCTAGLRKVRRRRWESFGKAKHGAAESAVGRDGARGSGALRASNGEPADGCSASSAEAYLRLSAIRQHALVGQSLLDLRSRAGWPAKLLLLACGVRLCWLWPAQRRRRRRRVAPVARDGDPTGEPAGREGCLADFATRDGRACEITSHRPLRQDGSIKRRISQYLCFAETGVMHAAPRPREDRGRLDLRQRRRRELFSLSCLRSPSPRRRR